MLLAICGDQPTKPFSIQCRAATGSDVISQIEDNGNRGSLTNYDSVRNPSRQSVHLSRSRHLTNLGSP